MRHSAYKLLLLSLALLGLSSKTSAQFNTPLMYDKYLSPVAGANNIAFLHKGLYSLEDRYLPIKLGDEKGAGKKALGMAYRMGKLFFLDIPQDYFFNLWQHEYFGHISRMKEAGYTNNWFDFTLPFPYGKGLGSANYGDFPFGKTVTAEHELSIFIGGNDANSLLATRISQEMLSTGKIHYRQAMLYLLNQITPSAYLILTQNSNPDRPFGGDGNDVKQYQTRINQTYYAGSLDGFSIDMAAQRTTLNFANPLIYYAFYNIFVDHICKGKARTSIPMITLGRLQYLPILQYNLGIFGDEYGIRNWVKHRNQLYYLDLNRSARYICEQNFWSMTAFADGLISTPKLKTQFQLSLWSQPEINLEAESFEKRPNALGGLIKADFFLYPFQKGLDPKPDLLQRLGLYLQVGYKTSGYRQGEILSSGPILRGGLSARF